MINFSNIQRNAIMILKIYILLFVHFGFQKNTFVKLNFSKIKNFWGNFYSNFAHRQNKLSHNRFAYALLKSSWKLFWESLRLFHTFSFLFHFYIKKKHIHNNIYFSTKAPTCTGDASIKASFFSLHPFTRYILNYSRRRTFLIFFLPKNIK